MNPSTTDQVIAIISESLGVEIEEIVPSSELKNDLNAAPEDFEHIVIKIEELFGITITKKELKEIITVQNMIDLIKDHLDEIDE